MGRSLRYLGMLLLAVTVWLLIGGAAGWVSQDLADRLYRTTAGAGAACLAGGTLLGLFGRLGLGKQRGRCIRCGAPTDRKQPYCLDHLLETVANYRDQSSQTPVRPRRHSP